METEIKITIPEGMEIDEENSTFKCIKFKPKTTTYNDVCKELFEGRNMYFITNDGDIDNVYIEFYEDSDDNKLVYLSDGVRILALMRLYNTAHYVNNKYPNKHHYTAIYVDPKNGIQIVNLDKKFFGANPIFNCEEAAKEAIKILGEETIREALENENRN